MISFNTSQATTITFELKPLCLHYKVANDLPSDTFFHKMTVTGSFTKSQMNIWLLSIFNETVKSIPDGEFILVYESILVKEKIILQVSDKRLEVYSQSVNSLIILKKYLQAKMKQNDVPITLDILPSS